MWRSGGMSQSILHVWFPLLSYLPQAGGELRRLRASSTGHLPGGFFYLYYFSIINKCYLYFFILFNSSFLATFHFC
ncbi:hypothetical protein BDA99DRAFT_507584 [Phascolomyces articulosus]|uniref:Uncharacterized protein n=1 Tax=Phascolomyces articulosus TaxID=60185 RepID=A0AAD5PEU9_9FUNG|nr:hypothetical protein BDA99DRAFT_507584 [Phascolomyces articulosus]